MHPLETDVRLAWKLVAQFVSWDFCRYVSQQSDNNESETDVLTFLRNMFVERTERLLCEVTQQELVAKLILEAKALRTPRRLPSLRALAESVRALCPPALGPRVLELMARLESLVTVLEDCGEPELVELRIEEEAALFAREANAHLPPPDLLRIIEPWVQGHSQPKGRQKLVFDPLLFEQVVRCLRKESITATEARMIAVAVCEDKVLQGLVLQADSETEPEPDSEPFSLSFRSSQDQPSPRRPEESWRPPPREDNSPPQDSLHFTQDSAALHRPAAAEEEGGGEEFALSSGSSSSEEGEDYDPRPRPLAEDHALFDGDTSDCDENASIRFLTPTFYREGASPPAGGVASQQSDAPSVDDVKRDPTWRGRKPRPVGRGDEKRAVPKTRRAEEAIPKAPDKSQKKKKLFAGIQDYFGREPSPPSRVPRLEAIPEVAEEVVVVTRPEIVHRRRSVARACPKKCRRCSKTFKTQIALKRHVFLKHPSPDPEDD